MKRFFVELFEQKRQQGTNPLAVGEHIGKRGLPGGPPARSADLVGSADPLAPPFPVLLSPNGYMAVALSLSNGHLASLAIKTAQEGELHHSKLIFHSPPLLTCCSPKISCSSTLLQPQKPKKKKYFPSVLVHLQVVVRRKPISEKLGFVVFTNAHPNTCSILFLFLSCVCSCVQPCSTE